MKTIGPKKRKQLSSRTKTDLKAMGLFGRLDLSYKSVSPDIFVVGRLSVVILRWYYNRRGDVR